jgi:hypothetical protein
MLLKVLFLDVLSRHFKEWRLFEEQKPNKKICKYLISQIVGKTNWPQSYPEMGFLLEKSPLLWVLVDRFFLFQIPRGTSTIDIIEAIRKRFCNDGEKELEFQVVCDIRKESPAVIQGLNSLQVSHIGPIPLLPLFVFF